MKARDLIDDSLIADASELDNALQQSGQGSFSISETLRVIRDVDTDELRRVARDVWGTGGSEGADLVGNSLSECVEGLNYANRQSAAWTGEANNAYSERIGQIVDSIEGGKAGHGVKELAVDIGQTLESLADSWDQIFGSGTVGEVLTWIGVGLSAIGLIVSLGLDFTVVGIPAGIILGIISVLVGAASIWWGLHAAEQNKIETATQACTDAEKTVRGLDNKNP